jgi:hypothetical protein
MDSREKIDPGLGNNQWIRLNITKKSPCYFQKTENCYHDLGWIWV